MKKNAPYVKKYVNGVLVNPITKENPYLNAPNVSFKKMLERAKNSTSRFWEQNRNKFFTGKSIVKY